MNPQLQSQIAVWRAKAASGTLTEEETIVAVRAIREGRIMAATTSAITKRAAAKAAIPNADQFLDELMGKKSEEA